MILCNGEALIDMLPISVSTGPDAFQPHPGGAVFNTAIALGRLGVDCGLLTGLSRDMFGDQLTEALRVSGVSTAHVIYSDRPSTLAFVRLTDGQASYSFFDESSAGRMLAPQDLPKLDAGVTALYFGGISLACEPAAETYAALLDRHADSYPVMIDPNIRPGFIADPNRYRARLNRMIGQSDIVKVSDEDLDWIDTGTGDVATKAARLLAQGPAVVIVTRGGAGATGYLRGGATVDVPSQKVLVVDTVGAGDTFNAGVLAQLSRDGALQKSTLATLSPDTLHAALSFGATVAAVTVSRAGANPPWAHEI
ncbi:carbohydrate kinase [Sulfitobacter albidus]|uniref:Carbohydrate kinase n=1 Tax=Sulfitobacter albidus TaxID=2829501 RepID=A0A975PLX5_9RHOB|nr:carbohydrate kinase [Sulfitobacter albidus]QUJ76129.1 carbohydrate kinase [Sulfitobacter albidus]